MERIGVGERGAGADDGGLGRSLHTREGRRSGQDGAAQLHDPEVEALEEVQAGDLALGAQDGLGICAQGSLVPGERPVLMQVLERILTNTPGKPNFGSILPQPMASLMGRH